MYFGASLSSFFAARLTFKGALSPDIATTAEFQSDSIESDIILFMLRTFDLYISLPRFQCLLVQIIQFLFAIKAPSLIDNVQSDVPIDGYPSICNRGFSFVWGSPFSRNPLTFYVLHSYGDF